MARILVSIWKLARIWTGCGGRIMWWSDNALDDYDGLERLDRLLQARKVVLRFEDGRRVVEVPVSPRARTAMRHVRDAYRAMAALEWLEILGP